MVETTYEVFQEGKTLNVSQILMNQYENKIYKLHFNFDGQIESSRKYMLFKNPVTAKHRIYPIDLQGCILFSTDVSKYAGVWESCLIAVDDDYNMGDGQVSLSECVYVSNTKKFITVKDGLLSDATISYDDNTNPAINKLIDDIVKTRNALVSYALSVNNDLNTSQVILDDMKSLEELYKEYLDKTEGYCHGIDTIEGSDEDNAKYYKEESANQALLSKRYAIGEDSIFGSDEDNAKYYSEEASRYVNLARTIYNSTNELINTNKISAINSTLISLQSSINSLTTSISSINSDITTLSSMVNNLSSRISTLEGAE